MGSLHRTITSGSIILLVIGAVSATRAQDVTVSVGRVIPGYAVAVAPAEGAPHTMCEPSCELVLPRGEVAIGWRRDDRPIEWQRTISLVDDLRLDVRLEDRSALRHAGYGLLIAGGLLLAASAIVASPPPPTRPENGWFGERHGLVFAGIAGGIVIAFGVSGVALALVFERDAPAIDAVPVDDAPSEDATAEEATGVASIDADRERE
jgi:hypothetical protein